MRSLISVAFRVYRSSPLYPHWGRRLSKALAITQRVRGNLKRVHDCGPFQLNIDLEQSIDAKIYYTGAHEGEVIEAIRRLVKPGDVCVDVGANIGFMTLHMATAAGKTGQVFAFEPSNWTYERLVANVALNGWQDHISCVRSAVGDKVVAETTMVLPCGYRTDGRDTATQQSLGVTTLDDFFERHPISRLDFLKSDTDGYEPYVIQGAERTIKRLKPILLFEVYPEALSAHSASLETLVRFLIELGYQFTDIAGGRINALEAANRVGPGESIDLIAQHAERR